ncbi:MAG: DUF2062 domain-containing protein [Rhizobiales bacterium]|nr:DUF2062 domain-containing protein [Hyphomicrobiales bacterium]
MLFSRRKPEGILARVRVALWPRRSWSRSMRYVLKRVRRLRGSPYFIAFGFACGAFVSCTPFVGFHFIIAAALAYIGRGSMIASAFGTAVGNPLTFPFIWVSTYQLGNAILGGTGRFSDEQLKHGFATLWESMTAFSSEAFVAAANVLWPLMKPMLVGSVPIGLAVASVIYLVMYRALLLAARRAEEAEIEEAMEAAIHNEPYEVVDGTAAAEAGGEAQCASGDGGAGEPSSPSVARARVEVHA